MKRIIVLDTRFGYRAVGGVVSDYTASRLSKIWCTLDSNKDLAILCEDVASKPFPVKVRAVVSSGIEAISVAIDEKTAAAFRDSLNMRYIPQKGVFIPNYWRKLGRVCTLYSLNFPVERSLRLHRNLSCRNCTEINVNKL